MDEANVKKADANPQPGQPRISKARLDELERQLNRLLRYVKDVEKSVAKIDTKDYAAVEDISGMIGQYIHGNEPSHHLAYLYDYAGEPVRNRGVAFRHRRGRLQLSH